MEALPYLRVRLKIRSTYRSRGLKLRALISPFPGNVIRSNLETNNVSAEHVEDHKSRSLAFIVSENLLKNMSRGAKKWTGPRIHPGFTTEYFATNDY